jgi:hypothetical protein
MAPASEQPKPVESDPRPLRQRWPRQRSRRISGLALLLLLAIVSVSVSLGVRVVHRGPYYPGWDVLGAAQGLLRVSTQTPSEILGFYATYHYRSIPAWNVYGAPIVLIPGWLASRWPSEWWPHAVTFAITVSMLWLLGRALELRRDEWAVLLLAWGASGTLLSYSVAGFAYITCFWPHALALWIVLRWQRRWLWTLALCALTVELSFHVQELGRTAFVVFALAALLIPDVPWKTRGVWLLAGAWQCWLSLLNPTFNTAHHLQFAVPADTPSRLFALAERVVTAQLDIPILLLTGVIGALFVRRNRWFWRFLLASQLGLVVLLALNDGTNLGVRSIWPRRTLLVSFLCVATSLAYFREASRRWMLVGLLLLGNGWQLASTVAWARQPLGWGPRREANFPLPFTQTTLDYLVPFGVVDWAREIRASVESGKRVVLVYNLWSWQENPTNPTSRLSRMESRMQTSSSAIIGRIGAIKGDSRRKQRRSE